MIRYGCCIPGGSYMPEGVKDVPKSLDCELITKCRKAINVGFDYTECGAAMLAKLTDEEFDNVVKENERESLKLYACNSLIPENFRLTGDNLVFDDLKAYLEKVLSRMNKLGVKIAVFGSGKARSKPEGYDHFKAMVQLEDFTLLFEEIAKKYGITLVIEPLRSKESNIFTNLAECASIVYDVKTDGIKLLADSFHMYEEESGVEAIVPFKDILTHCHMSEPITRAYPGSDDSADISYNLHFAGALLAIGYDGGVSVECSFTDFDSNIVDTYDYMKKLFEGGFEIPVITKINVTRDMIEEPLFVYATEGIITDDIIAFEADDGRTFAAQKKGNGVVVIITAKKGEKLTLTAVKGIVDNSPVSIENNEAEEKLTVKINGEYFSDYGYSKNLRKPYFGRICGENGNYFTRLDFETEEHPHHRSVFIGVGNVNGVDCWNESDKGGHSVNGEIRNIVYGPAYGSFEATTTWKDSEDNNLIDLSATYTVYAQSALCRYLDLKFVFTANYCDVRFGETKEAGPLGVRLRDELCADKGNSVIVNSYGGVGEDECWSKAANWVDYTGSIKDSDGNEIPLGVTIFDNENNERYPTCWHVRNYGLFAANNLFFKGGIDIPKGQSLEYNFRIVFHVSEFDRDDAVNRFIHYTKFDK